MINSSLIRAIRMFRRFHFSRNLYLIGIIFLVSLNAPASEQQEAQLEQEIRSILRNRTNAPVDQIKTGFCLKSTSMPQFDCLKILKKLKDDLLKIKKFKDLSGLTSLEIHPDSKWKTSTFYWKDHLDLIFYGAQDESVPWIALLSDAPLEENATEFKSDLISSMVYDLREHPLANERKALSEVRLPFRPYSSSYLSIKHGKILKTPELNAREDLPVSMLSDHVQSLYQSSSPIERLDRVRRARLGRTDSLLTEEFRNKVYDPNAEEWEGFCHQWTVSALDPKINEFIASTQGVICGDVYISEGELEELFTLFYSNYNTNLLSGKRSRQSPTENDRILRNQLGIDDLPAADFHQNIFKYLSLKKGIGIEISPDRDVWNQPVYRIDGTRTQELNDSVSQQRIAPFIPAELFESSDLQFESKLERYRVIDSKLRNWQESESSLSTSDQEWAARVVHLFKEYTDVSVAELIDQRSDLLMKVVLPGLKSGRIRLKEGVIAEAVSTRVEHGDEGMDLPFGSTGFVSKTRKYDYLLFKKNKKIIDSRWITHPMSRPDFIWIPTQPKDPKTGEAILNPEVVDLLKLGSVCQNAREVFSFFALVRKAVADSVLSEPEIEEIRKRYPRVSGVVKQDRLYQIFSKSKIQGIDLTSVLLPTSSQE